MRAAERTEERPFDGRGELLRRAAGLGRSLRWPAFGAFAAAAFGTAARLAGPLMVGVGIDRGVADGDKRVVTIAALTFMGLLVVQYVFVKISRYGIAWVGEQYLLKLRSVVFGHLIRSDTAFFSRSKSGVLVSRMTSDIESLQEFAGDGAVMAVSNTLTVIGVAIAMVLVDWPMAVATFAVIAVLVGVTMVFQRQAAKAYGQVRERIGRVLAGLQEGIAGVRVVQAFSQEQVQAASFGRVNEAHYRANMSSARAISWFFPTVGFLRVVSIAAVLVIGGIRVIDGSLTFGTLVVFLLYLDWFFQPIVNLANVYNLLQAAIAALAKLFTLLDVEAHVVEQPGAFDLATPVAGEIELRGVTFGYDDHTMVIRDVDLEIPRRPATRGRRRDRRGQVDDRKTRPALLRPAAWIGCDRRLGSHRSHDRFSNRRNRTHSSGRFPLQRHTARQPHLRGTRCFRDGCVERAARDGYRRLGAEPSGRTRHRGS